MDKINKDIVSAQLQITRDVMSAWKSQILFSLCSLGVFDALRDKPLRHETLAQILSVPAESLRRLLNAAVAAGYIEKCDGAYTNIEALQPVLFSFHHPGNHSVKQVFLFACHHVTGCVCYANGIVGSTLKVF